MLASIDKVHWTRSFRDVTKSDPSRKYFGVVVPVAGMIVTILVVTHQAAFAMPLDTRLTKQLNMPYLHPGCPCEPCREFTERIAVLCQ